MNPFQTDVAELMTGTDFPVFLTTAERPASPWNVGGIQLSKLPS
jgi:hypothetical protein